MINTYGYKALSSYSLLTLLFLEYVLVPCKIPKYILSFYCKS